MGTSFTYYVGSGSSSTNYAFANVYNTSSGTSGIKWNWLDSTPVTTELRPARCFDGARVLSQQSFGAGDLSQKSFGNPGSGYCFLLWGHTTSGSISTHDGRVSR